MVDGECGKGDKPRPISDREQYNKNFESIFGEWVSPREKRMKDLKKDLRECKKVLKNLPADDTDRSRIEQIVELIKQELKDL